MARPFTEQRREVLFECLPRCRLAAKTDVAVRTHEIEALAPCTVAAVECALRVEQHALLAAELCRTAAARDDNPRLDVGGPALAHATRDVGEVRVALGRRCGAVEEEERAVRVA